MAIGRFTGVDPISDQFAYLSTFNYASNDPILNIDLWGLQGVPFSYPTNEGNGAYSTYHYQSPMYGEAPDLLPVAEFAAGFTPAGTALDVKDFSAAAKEGDKVGMALSGIGFVPGIGDIAKAVGKVLRKFLKGADGIPTVNFSKSETPNISNNIEKAFEEGQPSVLTKEGNKSTQRKNRRDALKGQKSSSTENSLDEYPFASTKEGGNGARVQEVPVSEQNIQGGKLSQFYQKNNIQDGDKFKVKVTE